MRFVSTLVWRFSSGGTRQSTCLTWDFDYPKTHDSHQSEQPDEGVDQTMHVI